MQSVIEEIECQLSKLRLESAGAWKDKGAIQDYQGRKQDLLSQLRRALEIQRTLDSQK